MAAVGALHLANSPRLTGSQSTMLPRGSSLMGSVRYQLRPSDDLYARRAVPVLQEDGSTYWRAGVLDVPTPIAQRLLSAAGLLGALFVSPPSGDVGSFVLRVPAAHRVVKDDESDRLDSARQAALREMRRLLRARQGMTVPQDGIEAEADEDESARLLLLRDRAPAVVEAYTSIDLTLRTGEVIPVDIEDLDALPARMWAAIEVSATPLRWDLSGEMTPFFFSYRLVHAVPDIGPLTVSDVDVSLAKSLCFDRVCSYLMSCLDLSGEHELSDPPGAMHFLLDAHRTGLPSGSVPGAYIDEDHPRRTFVERLLLAMDEGRSDRRAGKSVPDRRLIKNYADAESYAAEYMRFLGWVDATTTPPGSDGGVDIVAKDAVAQVKMEGVPTGRPVIQAISGIAALEGKHALVFSLAGFTSQAREWAEYAGVACFEFAVDGSIEARGHAALALSTQALDVATG